MEKAKQIQEKLDDLQQEMHAKVEACDVRYNREKNDVFAARRKAISDLIAKKEVPENFWALALIALLQMKDRESATTPHFLGAYDESLLKTYLEEIVVGYTDKGHRITLRFKPNPFFEGTELWAEAVDTMDGESDEEDELPPVEESWRFSGVTWREGHGPQLDDDEEEEEEEDNGNGASGQKRPRQSNSASTSSSVQGPSVLEVFSEMPPHPEEDEEMDEEDDDALADAIEEWETEMDDRKMLLRMVELFVHHDPVSALRDTEAVTAAAAASNSGEEAAAKRAKND